LGLKGLDSDALLYTIQSAIVNTAEKLLVPLKASNFMASGGTISVQDGVWFMAFKAKHSLKLENSRKLH
jgi:hypothetical protein